MTHGLPQRPAAVVVDGFVYRGHQADGLGEGGDDALVVDLIVVAERAAFAVFQPLLADLIAADVELPHLRRDALEILRRVDVDAAGGPLPLTPSPADFMTVLEGKRKRRDMRDACCENGSSIERSQETQPGGQHDSSRHDTRL